MIPPTAPAEWWGGVTCVPQVKSGVSAFIHREDAVNSIFITGACRGGFMKRLYNTVGNVSITDVSMVSVASSAMWVLPPLLK